MSPYSLKKRVVAITAIATHERLKGNIEAAQKADRYIEKFINEAPEHLRESLHSRSDEVREDVNDLFLSMAYI
jgi:vacuolar-type H+-ATPase subunit H